jgi:hypothetical protein
MAERWRRCSACKQDIALGAQHYVCSVSTCNRKRTGLVFCSVDCWEIHLPTERHREAWAVEARAPTTPDPPAPAKREPSPNRSRASTVGQGPAARSASTSAPIVRKRGDRASETRLVRPAAPVGSASAPSRSGGAADDGEILVVASRLKAYVRDRSGFNTSDRVLPLLSRALRVICDEAIENARRAERLTVMGRDVPRD